MHMDSSRHGSFGAGPMKTRFWVELRYAFKGGCHKVLKMYIGASHGPKIVNWPVTGSQKCNWTRHKVPKNVNWTRRKVPHMYMDPSQGPKNVNCTRHKVPKMYMDPSQGPKRAIRPVTRSQKFISASSSSSSSSSGSFQLLRLPQSKGQLFRARSNFDVALSGRVLPKGDVGRVSIRPFSGPGRLKGVWGRVSTRPLRGRSCQRGRGSRFDMVLFGVEPAT